MVCCMSAAEVVKLTRVGKFDMSGEALGAMGRANWTIRVFDTGAMPHFEAEAEFITAYDAFLAGVPSALPA